MLLAPLGGEAAVRGFFSDTTLTCLLSLPREGEDPFGKREKAFFPRPIFSEQG
jgi:hypothetical protein